MTSVPDINTPQLVLRSMSEDFLEASLAGYVQKANSLIGLKVSDDWFDEKDIMRIRLIDYRVDREYIPWGLRGVGWRTTGEMIGFIGFHSRPDFKYIHTFAPNSIEFGYTIFFNYRRHGFASEAIAGLLNWGLTEHAIENFIASVSPTNTPSTQLIKKLGFEKIGEQIDETDGLEFVYGSPAGRFREGETG